jgi:hypothetical protein
MASREEHKALISGFPRLSPAHRETAIQALAKILVADYQRNQDLSSSTVTTGTLRNRSGSAGSEPEK